MPILPGAEVHNPELVHESAYVNPGAKIGAGTRIWHFSNILGGVTIGTNCVISQNVMIGPDVVVGDNCKIQNNVSLYKGVILEDGVFCGPSCVFTNVNTPRAEVNRKHAFLETRIGRGATIGANATIVCGNALGRFAFIAAGAVVTKTVPPHALMMGNPARQKGWVSHAGEVLGPDMTCPMTGDIYEVQAGALIRIKPGASAGKDEG
jgi:UDP-2-acetamido-3-amino-2,3-dideoxy-glucuronate N-acetyltransferase